MKFPYVRSLNLRTHFPAEFTMEGFREVLVKISKTGGRKILTLAFTLYYCLKDTETPTWAKSVIVGALGYLILPMDLIPDAIPGAGFTDDWSVLLGAMATVMAHIKEEHRALAGTMAAKFLGSANAQEPDSLDSKSEQA